MSMKIGFLHYALLLSLAFGFGSCSESTSSEGQTKDTTSRDTMASQDRESTEDTLSAKADCPADVICTMMFATVSTTVKDKQNRLFELDSYKVIDSATGKDRTPAMDSAQAQMQRKSGTYAIVTDADVKELANKQIEVEFIGYKAAKEVVRRKFTVGADCCHVRHIAGELEIVVEK